MQLPRHPSLDDPSGALSLALREAAQVAGHLATYCDHVEHNEPADWGVLRDAGRRLRHLGLMLADELDLPLLELYASRLAGIERAHVLAGADMPAYDQAVRDAASWRDLQTAQAGHDRVYHPDVAGLSKLDQLRHYTLHVAKLAGHLARLLDAERADLLGFAQRRLPDFLLFGVKLATLAGQRLAEAPDQEFQRLRAAGGFERDAASWSAPGR